MNTKQIAVPDLRAMGRRIREVRGFDLTQVEFAKILGITEAQLSKYERGQSAPTLALSLKIKHFSGKEHRLDCDGRDMTVL